MKLTRKRILETLIDNVPSTHPFLGIPYMIITVSKTDGDETERTRLIEDLEMDSLDVYSMICDTCDELNVEFYGSGTGDEKIGRLRTLGDCVDLIESFNR